MDQERLSTGQRGPSTEGTMERDNEHQRLSEKSYGSLLLQKLSKIYTCTYIKRIKVESLYGKIAIFLQMSTSLRSPVPYIAYLFWSFWPVRSHKHQILHSIYNTLGHPAEHHCKRLLLKRTHALFIKQREVNLVLTSFIPAASFYSVGKFQVCYLRRKIIITLTSCEP